MPPQELAKCWNARFLLPYPRCYGTLPLREEAYKPLSRVRDTHTGSSTAPQHRRGAGGRQAHSQAEGSERGPKAERLCELEEPRGEEADVRGEGTACRGVRAPCPSAAAQTLSPHKAPGVAGSSRETGGPAPQHREDADGPRQGDQSRHGGRAPASPRAAQGESPATRTHANVK